MVNLIKKGLLIASVIAMPLVASADKEMKIPEGSFTTEVHVKSLQFLGGGIATLIARPCDEAEVCDDILARANAKTFWYDNQKIISYRQAKSLHWKGAILFIDKYNNALALGRISPWGIN